MTNVSNSSRTLSVSSPSNHRSIAGRTFGGALPSIAILTLVAGFTPATAWANTITPLTQVRSAFADSFVVSSPTSDQDLVDVHSPGLAPFSIAFETLASGPIGVAAFDVMQESAFRPYGFIAEGSTESTSTIVQNGGFCYSVGSSSAIVTMSVPAGATYRVAAHLVSGVNGQTKLTLSGPGGVLVSKSLIGQEAVVRATGTLTGGTWTLQVSSFSSTSLSAIGSDVDAGSFTLVFSTSPSAADLDLDGSVSAADLAILLGAWGPCQGCAADIDADGTVGPADLATLLGEWS